MENKLLKAQNLVTKYMYALEIKTQKHKTPLSYKYGYAGSQ